MLIGECRISSTREALELLEHMYPAHEPSPKTRLLLESLFGRLGRVTLAAR